MTSSSDPVTDQPFRLAVIGSPISHSKSPVLHAAAYRELNLTWQYSALEVKPGELAGFISSLDASWRGLSLTMPLKRELLALLTTTDRLAGLTGVANTAFFDWSDGVRRVHGFNTDVYGVTSALSAAGVTSVNSVQILGAGATAASAMVAVSELGAGTVQVSARSPHKADRLLELGARLGIHVRVGSLNDGAKGGRPDLIVSTLPNGAQTHLVFDEETRRQTVLFEVAYDPWPTPLAASWLQAGGLVVSGLQMLVYQALAQVRIFIGGEPEHVLPDEGRVLAAMLSSVGLSSRP